MNRCGYLGREIMNVDSRSATAESKSRSARSCAVFRRFRALPKARPSAQVDELGGAVGDLGEDVAQRALDTADGVDLLG